MIRAAIYAVVLLVAAALAPAAVAQLPAARVAAVFPPGGAPGTTVDVTATGVDLDAATELRFSHAGITAKKADGPDSQTEAKFTVTVGQDVPAGRHEAHVVGRFGISNPREFVVEAARVATDVKPAGSASDATKLPLDTAVFARSTANGVDHWAFEAKQGQRLIIVSDARVLDSKLVPDVAVLDPAGREVARSRRTGLLDFTAPADGTFTLRVSDLLFRGGPEFAYRLCVSTGPRVDAVFPSVAKRGSRGTFTLLGRNLPGGQPSPYVAADGKPLETLRVDVDVPEQVAPDQRLDAAGLVGPGGAAVQGFAYRLKSERGASNPVAILLAEADVTPEAESAQPQTARNDRPEDAQRLPLPSEVAGRFHPRNDRDCYAVEAKKGDAWVVEVVADRAGAPMAVSLVVQKVGTDGAAGDVFASGDDEANPGTPAFRTATRDPQWRWDVKEDGLYRLSLRDRFGASTDDPARGYRLSIRRPAPDFALVVTPLSGAGADAAVWSPTLRRGGVAAVRVGVVRVDGHAGDVTVTAEGLPPGVTCAPLLLPAGETAGVLAFRAAEDAKAWAGTVKVVAAGHAAGADVKREAVYGTVVWGTPADAKNNDATRNIDPVVSRPSRDLALGVCDEAEPVTVAAAEAKTYEVQAGQKLTVPLAVKRSADLKQALKLKPVGGEALRNAKEVTIDAKKDTGTLELDLAQTKLAPGTYSICLASPAQFKYTRPGTTPPGGGGDGGKMAKGKGDGEKDKGKKKDEAKDVTVTVYSAPITFTVLPAPEKSEKSDKKKS